MPQLTVEENVFLGVEPRGARLRLAPRRCAAATSSSPRPPACACRPRRPPGACAPAEQQKVEILRALARDAELIVMDEPTAALGAEETAQLHEIVRSLAGAGRTVLLVSHFLREVLALADEVTVLRDGRLVRTAPAAEQTEDSLIQAMLGRPLDGRLPAQARGARRRAGGPHRARPARAARRGREPHRRTPARSSALAGLVGAGRTELARAIFGAERRDRGHGRAGRRRRAVGRPAVAAARGRWR